jgi:hypothetical protein
MDFWKWNQIYGLMPLWYTLGWSTWKKSSTKNVEFFKCRIFRRLEASDKIISFKHFRRKLFSLSFKTNRTSNGWTSAEKSQKYQDHRILGQKQGSCERPCHCFEHNSSQTQSEGLIFLPLTFQTMIYRMATENWNLKLLRGATGWWLGGPSLKILFLY